MRPDDYAVRFWDRVQIGDGCWEWPGATVRGGYGRARCAGGVMLAHRFAYVQFVGSIPADKTIDHLCANRLCVRPSHLEAVSQAENKRRGGAPHFAALPDEVFADEESP